MQKTLFVATLILILALIGCTNNSPTGLPLIETDKIATLAAATLSASPADTSAPSATATPSPTATPARPGLPAPVVPEVSAPISVENVGQLARLTSLGEGDLLDVQTSPDGKWVILATGNGILVLEPVSLKKVTFLPMAVPPAEVIFINDGKELAARDCYEGYVWSMQDWTEIRHITWPDPGPIDFFTPQCKNVPDQDWSSVFQLSSDEHKAGLYRFDEGKVEYFVDYNVFYSVISPDKKLIALNKGDELMILNYQDGKVIAQFQEEGINSLLFYPDGSALVAVFRNLVTIKIWDTVDLQLIKSVHNNGPFFFSPDNSIIACADGRGVLFLRAADGEVINVISGNKRTLKFTSDSQGVFIDDNNGYIRHFVFNEDRSKINFRMTYSGMSEVQYVGSILEVSPDNSKLLILQNTTTSNPDKILLIYDVDTGFLLQKFPLADENYHYIQPINANWISPLNTFGVIIGSGREYRYLGTLDLNSGVVKKYFEKISTGSTASIKFSPQSDLLVSNQEFGGFIWDLKNNSYWENPKKISNDYDGRPTTIVFSADQKTLYITNAIDMTYLYSLDNYKLEMNVALRYFFSEDGIIGYTDGTDVIFADEKTKAPIHQFEAKNSYLEYNTVKKLLVTVSEGDLTVWDVSELLAERLVFSTKVMENWEDGFDGFVKFSHDGNFVAATYQKSRFTGEVNIWNSESGELLKKFGLGYSAAFDFSPDNKLIAISYFSPQGNAVSIYEMNTWNEVFTTGNHFSAGMNAPRVSFSPDGKYLAILPAYGLPQIWGIP